MTYGDSVTSITVFSWLQNPYVLLVVRGFFDALKLIIMSDKSFVLWVFCSFDNMEC